jgi:hypothetical protein
MAATAVRNTYFALFALCIQYMSTINIKPMIYDHRFAKQLGYSPHAAQR